MGDRLWTNQKAFWKFRKHDYEDIERALQLYRIRPPTSLSLPTHEPSNVFTASITIAEVCSTSGCCSAHSVKNFQQQLLEYMSLLTYTQPTFGTIVSIAKLRGSYT